MSWQAHRLKYLKQLKGKTTMSDLAIFSENSNTEKKPAPSNGATANSAMTKKGKGGGLAKRSASSKATALSNVVPPEALQNIEIINRKFGAEFTPALLAKLTEVADSWEANYTQERMLEEALVIAADKRSRDAAVEGRQRGQLQIKLRELIELKKEAAEWMDTQFDILITKQLGAGLPATYVQQLAESQAANFHIDLNDYKLNADGSCDAYTPLFLHENEITLTFQRLSELGIDIQFLLDSGVDIRGLCELGVDSQTLSDWGIDIELVKGWGIEVTN